MLVNPLRESDIYLKISQVRSEDWLQLKVAPAEFIPHRIGRDADVLPPDFLPKKKGLSMKEGQARMLHDLASIELQAMELGLRSLVEFPEAPPQFREELYKLTLQESEHLELCLQGLEKLGYAWGAWPVHTMLWQAVASDDTLLDRILIVHRYLEGSGLDAGDTLLRRLTGVSEGPLHAAARRIVTEEVEHVLFGSEWYRRICAEQKLDPDQDFKIRFTRLQEQLPKRIEPLSIELRKRAGFSDSELTVLSSYRESLMKYPPKI